MRHLHLRGHVELTEGEVLPEAWVVDGRIQTSRPEELRNPRVIDGWAVPGLVDVHCHIGLLNTGAADEDTSVAQAVTDRDTGVLLIRDAGSPFDTSWVHDRPELPRLIRSGAHIARPKRYLRYFGVELEDPRDLPQEVRKQARAGDGWVKIVADWIDRADGDAADLTPLWPDDVLKEAVDAAHEEGARVLAHTFAHEAIDPLLDAGVDCLEHGTGLSVEQIERVVAQGVAVTPTLVQIQHFGEFADQADERFPRYAARMRTMHANRFELVRRMHEAGVQLLVGTDAGGTLEHGQIAHECELLVEAGIPASDVLAMASWRTWDYLGVPKPAPGREADLVVYPSDPRADISALRKPEAVILRGRIVAGNLAE